jgi:ABC-2 type transport system ATP-binding protein
MREPTTTAAPVASGGGAAISIAGLTKDYGDRRAVDGLDVELPRGVVAGFIGPNGAGKTTTMAMLLGLVRPSSGTGEVLGVPLDQPNRFLPRVGALIEGPALYPGLSGVENLRVLAAVGGKDPSAIPELLDLVGLGDRGDDRFKEYSLGMKQRLGIAGALLGDPELLILDEPTNGLDPKGMADMRAIIRRVGRGERTVLLSSHLLGEVQQVCDRVGVIQRGRLVIEGTVEELRGGSGILVRVEPLEKAREIAADLDGVEGAQIRDGMLMVDADPGRAAEVNAGLVSAGLRVSELRPVERSLEDVFLELTGGETV